MDSIKAQLLVMTWVPSVSGVGVCEEQSCSWAAAARRVLSVCLSVDGLN